MRITLLVDVFDSFYRIAVVDKDELLYLDADAINPKAILDSIYHARILKKDARQILWELEPGLSAVSRHEKSFAKLNVGQWAYVQVTREGFNEIIGPIVIAKPIEVSQNLTFVEESLVFQPYGLGITPRTGKEPLPEHEERVHSWFEAITREKKHGLVWYGPNSLERIFRDQPWGPIESIELSAADAVSYVHQACTKYAPWLMSAVQLKQPQLITLLEDWGGEDKWQDTLSSYIEVGQEGSVIIQTTSVATTMDINAGYMDEEEANFNLCQLLANQLIWRRLGGRVLIDFAGIQDNNRLKQRLVDQLREALVGDTPRWHILGWSKSGLLELQRERRRCALEQVVGYHEKMSDM